MADADRSARVTVFGSIVSVPVPLATRRHAFRIAPGAGGFSIAANAVFVDRGR
jgi:hypothetical protein